MRPVKALFPIVLLSLIVLSFSNLCSAQSSQGISGTVVWKEGNHMPTVGGSSSGLTKKVSREIIVYPFVKMGEVKGNGPLFEEVNAIKVASVKADKNGKYRLRLKPGKYSVFIKEKGKLYANRFDDGGINPIEVKKGRFSKMDIVIDYEAAY